MADKPVTVQEGSGFYTDETQWPNSAEHGNGTYGPSHHGNADEEVEITGEGLEQAQEDEEYVSKMLNGDF